MNKPNPDLFYTVIDETHAILEINPESINSRTVSEIQDTLYLMAEFMRYAVRVNGFQVIRKEKYRLINFYSKLEFKLEC